MTQAVTPAVTTDEDRVLGDDGEFHAAAEEVVLPKYGFEDWITFGLFWLLALDVFYQFFTRYVLEDSAAWTEEIARYLLITVVFLGGAMGVRRNTHIHVEFLYRYVPATLARAASTAVDYVRVAAFARPPTHVRRQRSHVRGVAPRVLRWSRHGDRGC